MQLPANEIVLIDKELERMLVLSPFSLGVTRGGWQYLWLDGKELDKKEGSLRYRHPVLVEQFEDMYINIDDKIFHLKSTN